MNIIFQLHGKSQGMHEILILCRFYGGWINKKGDLPIAFEEPVKQISGNAIPTE